MNCNSISISARKCLLAFTFTLISWGMMSFNASAQFSISGSVGGTLDGTYATLTGAGALPNAGGGVFAAINSVAQTGATITVSVTGNSIAENESCKFFYPTSSSPYDGRVANGGARCYHLLQIG